MELEYQVSGMVACRRVNRRVNYQPDDVALDLSNAVYGSNTLDSRGTSWQHTLRIYNAICWGNSVTAAIPAPEEDPDYASHVYHLVERGRKATGAAVAESRQQTINHALALRYLVDEVVARRQPVTGVALCEAHRLLVTGWSAPRLHPEVLDPAGVEGAAGGDGGVHGRGGAHRRRPGAGALARGELAPAAHPRVAVRGKDGGGGANVGRGGAVEEDGVRLRDGLQGGPGGGVQEAVYETRRGPAV
ncbi:hypothetical protein ISF_01494 [Cordyceps fumosorosea ARSEF 2679]|uniref:Uncharacterized protein n=1 Tax=Cordyceps fumosorosea (strain ARSEF 2679) TaxID=1081104 RepID=A0A168DC17_CORFA|nr:hypothetical protein ISF_01494 [Cordyceps fumosorosea ARSEF 2679]OAA72421.1 hypothetical protein ISF_01494 [Cordyceps fumosorosea ARSEF 2679]